MDSVSGADAGSIRAAASAADAAALAAAASSALRARFAARRIAKSALSFSFLAICSAVAWFDAASDACCSAWSRVKAKNRISPAPAPPLWPETFNSASAGGGTTLQQTRCNRRHSRRKVKHRGGASAGRLGTFAIIHCTDLSDSNHVFTPS